MQMIPFGRRACEAKLDFMVPRDASLAQVRDEAGNENWARKEMGKCVEQMLIRPDLEVYSFTLGSLLTAEHLVFLTAPSGYTEGFG